MNTYVGTARRSALYVTAGIAIFAMIVLAVFVMAGSKARAAQAPVELGTAGDFALLAGSTITNTGPTTITGDVGLHPGSSATGFNSVTLNGDLHVADAVAEQAKIDLGLAYDNASGRGPATTVPTELGETNLTAGVYTSSSGTFGITGTLELDAEGDPDAVFIFQMTSTLVTATAGAVELINGADACNVFWQVGSSATLGAGTSFKGSILASASITLNIGSTIDGRSLARSGAVTMNTNTITRSVCTTATPTPTPTPTATPTPTPTATPTPTLTATPTLSPTPTATATAPTPSPITPSIEAAEQRTTRAPAAPTQGLAKTGADNLSVFGLGFVLFGLALKTLARRSW